MRIGRQFLNYSSLFSPNFSQLLYENFHIISISTDSIIVLPTGHGPWEIRGKSVSLSLSMISCWLVAFTPSQRAVFLSILHGLLHFFLSLVDIHHDEVFFPWSFFWAYTCCLLLLLILATNTPLPCFVPQTWSACLRSAASRVWGSSGELVPRQEWLLHWRLCHSAAPGHARASRPCQVQLLCLVAILIILSLPKHERGMSSHLFSSSLFSFNKSSFVFLFFFNFVKFKLKYLFFWMLL